MGQPEKFTAEEVTEALRKAKGFVSVAAKNLDCSPQTIRNYMTRYAGVRRAVTDSREEMKDFAESKLFSEINQGNITAIIFYLKTQGRDRGYVERMEHSGVDGPLVITVRYQDKPDA